MKDTVPCPSCQGIIKKCLHCGGTGRLPIFDKRGRLRSGLILYTKDGRKIGNAKIVSSKFYKFSKVKAIVSFIGYRIKTDFGNTTILTMEEMQTLFYLTKK